MPSFVNHSIFNRNYGSNFKTVTTGMGRVCVCAHAWVSISVWEHHVYAYAAAGIELQWESAAREKK